MGICMVIPVRDPAKEKSTANLDPASRIPTADRHDELPSAKGALNLVLCP